MADPHGTNRVTEDGLSRREMLRRAIIVGGALVWAAPAIQTLSPPAYADVSPGISTCCQCVKTGGAGPQRRCFANDPTADTDAECTTKCSGFGNYVKEEFHQDFPAGSGSSFSCTGGNNSQCTPDPH